MPISGILCKSDFLGGWPSVFYVFGNYQVNNTNERSEVVHILPNIIFLGHFHDLILRHQVSLAVSLLIMFWPMNLILSGAIGCLWFVVWMLVVHDTPAQHPRISQEEKDYIESSVGTRQVTSHSTIISIDWHNFFRNALKLQVVMLNVTKFFSIPLVLLLIKEKKMYVCSVSVCILIKLIVFFRNWRLPGCLYGHPQQCSLSVPPILPTTGVFIPCWPAYLPTWRKYFILMFNRLINQMNIHDFVSL